MKLLDDVDSVTAGVATTKEHNVNFQSGSNNNDTIGQALDVHCIKTRSIAEIQKAARSSVMGCICFEIFVFFVCWAPYFLTYMIVNSVGTGKTDAMPIYILVNIVINIISFFICRCLYKFLFKVSLQYRSIYLIHDKNSNQLQVWINKQFGSTYHYGLSPIINNMIQCIIRLLPCCNNNNNNNNNIYGEKMYDIGDKSMFIGADIREFDRYVTRSHGGNGHPGSNPTYTSTSYGGSFAKLEFYFENRNLPFRLENPYFEYNEATQIVDKINNKWGKNNNNNNNNNVNNVAMVSIIAIEESDNDNNDAIEANGNYNAAGGAINDNDSNKTLIANININNDD